MRSLDEAFVRVFARAPHVHARAPGRVNLVGEHTDYNEGLVLPLAIARGVTMVAAGNETDAIRLHSVLYDALVEFPAADPAAAALPAWARYTQGVAVGLTARGAILPGMDVAIGGDLQTGAGLSSSAALEVASALILERGAGVILLPRERAHLCHEAEVSFVGIPCGIMDQFASSLSRAGHALFLDCRSLETRHVPLPPEVAVAVCDTGVRRAVGDSAYAARREECNAAVRWLQDRGHRIRSLRDLSTDDMPEVEAMPDPLRRRARHVISENARVIDCARALEGGEILLLRDLFLASHRSLRDDYDVSCPELDAMVASALEAPGCLAARMTGAGFGGAVVALVRRADAAAFLMAADALYRRRTHASGLYFTSDAVSGAH